MNLVECLAKLICGLESDSEMRAHGWRFNYESYIVVLLY